MGRNLAVTQWCEPKLKANASYVDVGCGYGWLVYWVARRFSSGLVVGVESDEMTRTIACSVVANLNVSVIGPDSYSAPEYSSKFDVFTAIEVLEHIPASDRQEFLTTISKSLRPGAIGLITTPASTIRSRFLDPAFWIVGHTHFHEQELCRLLANAGFRVIQIKMLGGIFEVISNWDLYFSKWVLRRNPIGLRFYRGILDKEWSEFAEGWSGWWIEVQKI